MSILQLKFTSNVKNWEGIKMYEKRQQTQRDDTDTRIIWQLLQNSNHKNKQLQTYLKLMKKIKSQQRNRKYQQQQQQKNKILRKKQSGKIQ